MALDERTRRPDDSTRANESLTTTMARGPTFKRILVSTRTMTLSQLGRGLVTCASCAKASATSSLRRRATLTAMSSRRSTRRQVSESVVAPMAGSMLRWRAVLPVPGPAGWSAWTVAADLPAVACAVTKTSQSVVAV